MLKKSQKLAQALNKATPLVSVPAFNITRRYPGWMEVKQTPGKHLMLHEQESAVDNYYEYADFRVPGEFQSNNRQLDQSYVPQIQAVVFDFFKKQFPKAKIDWDTRFETLGCACEDFLPELNRLLAKELIIKSHPAVHVVEQRNREQVFNATLSISESMVQTPSIGCFIDCYNRVLNDWIEKSNGGRARNIKGFTSNEDEREEEVQKVLDFYRATKQEGYADGELTWTDVFTDGVLERFTNTKSSTYGSTPLYVKMSNKMRDTIKAGKVDQALKDSESTFEYEKVAHGERHKDELERERKLLQDSFISLYQSNLSSGKKVEQASEGAYKRIQPSTQFLAQNHTENIYAVADKIEKAQADLYKNQSGRRMQGGKIEQ